MVVLGVVGPPRSGKRKLAEALCAEHGFRLLFLGMPSEQRLNISSSFPSSTPLRSPRSQRGRQGKEGIYICKPQTPSNEHDVPPEKISNNSCATMGTLTCEAAGNEGHCDGGKDRTKREDVWNASNSNSQLHLPKQRTEDSAGQIVAFEGNVDALVDYVTQRWQNNFVVLGLSRLQHVQALRRRPFFALVAVEAPLRVRAAFTDAPQTAQALLEELLAEDAVCFASAAAEDGKSDGVRACMKIADVHVTSDGDFETLRKKISGSWLNEELVRPSWDTYFMRIAFLAATRSNCMKRRVGALVVRRNRIIATGYNGTPAKAENCKDGGCARCNNPLVFEGRRLDACECIHAEVNALLEAGRDRAQESTLYVTCLPCLGCAKLAVQCLVRSVIYAEEYDKTSGALDLFKRMGVAVHQYNDLHPGVPGETLAMRCI